MDNEFIFRLILILGFAMIIPVGLYHRINAQKTGERLDRRQEGLLILLTLRPTAGLAMIGLIAYLINPELMAWSSMKLPLWFRWIGVIIGMAAGFLLIVTFRALGNNITDTVVTRIRHTLVTTGPYKWVRHPFYVAFALAVVANSLVTANWFIALTGGICFGLIVLRTRMEEANLLKQFGQEYRDYMTKTGRFLPRI